MFHPSESDIDDVKHFNRSRTCEEELTDITTEAKPTVNGNEAAKRDMSDNCSSWNR